MLAIDQLLMETSCAVCLEVYKGDQPELEGARVLPCGHTACGSCLRQILRRTPNCPTCRAPTQRNVDKYPIARQFATLGAALTAAAAAQHDQPATIAERADEVRGLQAALAGKDAELAELRARLGGAPAAAPNPPPPATVVAAPAVAAPSPPPPAAPNAPSATASNGRGEYPYDRLADLRMRHGAVQVLVEWAGNWPPALKRTWQPLRNVKAGPDLDAVIKYVYVARPNTFRRTVREELAQHGVDFAKAIREPRQ